MKRIIIQLLIVLISLSSFAQGNLLIIGGGSEKSSENSWNHAAYKWAVDQSENKKVAIIAFGTADNWLPDYFVNQCGAAEATNFNISNSTTADAQTTYDDLMACDVIFLKGGDQYNYYSTYKGTKTEQAIEDKFSEGGVICGTSAGLAVLSEVIFTAKNGSAYPDDCIKNPEHSDIQLANDFFPFFPGYLFDSHFTIRARFGRLVAFMANWKFNQNESIVGIGVDEMTAMSIDDNNMGTVYGIGTVNIYTAFSENTFSQNSKLLADSIQVNQLLQGCTIDFNTGEITGLTEERNPTIKQEKGNYIVYASGSDNISDNLDMISDFVNDNGSTDDKILIVTGSSQTIANSYKTQLTTAGATDIEIYSATIDMASNDDFANAVAEASKILFVNNSYADLKYFLNGGTAGEALNAKIRSNGFVSAFIGDNSRLIGQTVVQNYLEADATYYGELTFNEGLNLLKTTAIIPNTYKSSDYYENTSAAIPYAMITDTLTYGIWLNRDNYIKYGPTDNNETYVNAYGTSPVMILKNDGTKGGFSEQSAYGYTNDTPPQFAGFENMTLSLIDESTPYKVGNEVEVTTAIEPTRPKNVKIFVINTDNRIHCSWPQNQFFVKVFDTNGRIMISDLMTDQGFISTTTFNSGVYIVNLKSDNQVFNQRIFISN
ncbi:MAG: Type 1 glutamine amidotransferase-like domain-containing protein [Bacteroidetes bacterium]|nr:Type 1 glutamine amidotransferase-like domain-containing protein [Bacteroidota bacterium]